MPPCTALLLHHLLGNSFIPPSLRDASQLSTVVSVARRSLYSALPSWCIQLSTVASVARRFLYSALPWWCITRPSTFLFRPSTVMHPSFLLLHHSLVKPLVLPFLSDAFQLSTVASLSIVLHHWHNTLLLANLLATRLPRWCNFSPISQCQSSSVMCCILFTNPFVLQVVTVTQHLFYTSEIRPNSVVCYILLMMQPMLANPCSTGHDYGTHYLAFLIVVFLVIYMLSHCAFQQCHVFLLKKYQISTVRPKGEEKFTFIPPEIDVNFNSFGCNFQSFVEELTPIKTLIWDEISNFIRK